MRERIFTLGTERVKSYKKAYLLRYPINEKSNVQASIFRLQFQPSIRCKLYKLHKVYCAKLPENRVSIVRASWEKNKNYIDYNDNNQIDVKLSRNIHKYVYNSIITI